LSALLIFTDVLLLISCSMLIHYLTKKDVPFIWGTPKDFAFKELKCMVMSALVLVMPDSEQPYRVEADGSGVATGAFFCN
jgi:hypothetical protein